MYMYTYICIGICIHINNLYTQTPRDMSFIPDVSVHYTIFKTFSI